ncbi:hypothetical protein KXD40_007721 [Peronospora effusa]|nr:hypothetical protein KXD40_007721 [Peronospora effusa]
MMGTITCGPQARRQSRDLYRALVETNTAILIFPPCATNLVQTADSFLIFQIKDEWTRRWDIKKFELIQSNEWSNNLASDCVRDVNSMRDNAGLTYARKAMIHVVYL